MHAPLTAATARINTSPYVLYFFVLALAARFAYVKACAASRAYFVVASHFLHLFVIQVAYGSFKLVVGCYALIYKIKFL